MVVVDGKVAEHTSMALGLLETVDYRLSPCWGQGDTVGQEEPYVKI